MEGLAPTLSSLTGERASAETTVAKFATFPRPSLPNAATTGAAPPQRERERGRYRMTQPNKSAVGPAWERKMPIRTERASEGRAAGKPIKNYMPSNRQLQRILLHIP